MPPRKDHTLPISKLLASRVEANGGFITPSGYKALTERVRRILKEVDDPYEVAGVCLLAADYDGMRFTPSMSLKWISYDFIKRQAGVPPGAWKWQCWLMMIPSDTKLHDTVFYWLRYLIDGIEAFEQEDVELAQSTLDRLWEREVGEEGLW